MNTQLNVMVIDDHPLQTTILTQILNRYCAQVTSFNGVDDAIQCAQRQHFDVIFAISRCREKDGIDMMEMLDQIQYQGQVVLVSAMELTIISAVRAMCEGFSFEVLGKLPKPYDENQVVELLSLMKGEKTKSRRLFNPSKCKTKSSYSRWVQGE